MELAGVTSAYRTGPIVWSCNRLQSLTELDYLGRGRRLDGRHERYPTVLQALARPISVADVAAVLRDQINTDTETLAKLTTSLQHRQLPDWVANIGTSTLVVIDEAGMADTLSLDAAVAYVVDRGGSVRLIGDDQQLSAIGAGGVLRDIQASHGAVRLTELLRLKELLGLSLEELKAVIEAEDARAALRREWHGGVEDPVRRRQILEESLGHIARQLELVRRRRDEIAALEGELVARRKRVRSLLRELAVA